MLFIFLLSCNDLDYISVYINNEYQLDFINSVLDRTKDKVRYNGSYFVIDYPNGDIPSNFGVCTDVIIRSYRKIGVDLQKLIHEDIKNNFYDYPISKHWPEQKYADSNIDHRRVKYTLSTSFKLSLAMEALLSIDGLLSLVTLTFLEIVLGIDNIIFISLVTQDLDPKIQPKARQIGIGLAMLFRVLMLLGITWLIGLTAPIFELGNHPVSGRDAILFIGGVFLLAKASTEIVKKTEGKGHVNDRKSSTLVGAIIQIGLLDIVFSFDSVLTAIGMTENIAIMIIAVVISMGIMLVFAKPIGAYIEKHMALQILALSFLIMIGTVLIAESAHIEIPKPYVYSSVGFALVVQLLSIRAVSKRK